MTSMEHLLTTPELCVILVEPEQPRNVGAAVRAAVNFGVKEFRIVTPSGQYDPESLRLSQVASSGAWSLANVTFYENLPDALERTDVVIGTSGRQRAGNMPQASHPRQFAMVRLLKAGVVAIAFGRESQGLTSAELDLCHGLLRLPVSPQFPSLNLSHAVAVTVYAWHSSDDSDTPQQGSSARPAANELRELWMNRADFPVESKGQMRQLLARASATEEDMAMLFNWLKALKK